jgi:hypothetical protein
MNAAMTRGDRLTLGAIAGRLEGMLVATLFVIGNATCAFAS